MKVITISKALLFCLIVGQNTSVSCAGEAAKQTAHSGTKPAGGAAAGTTANPARGAAAKPAGTTAKGNDGRTAITLEVNNKSCNKYSYTRSGNNEKFTVTLGYKISRVTKGGVEVWSGKGKFAKEIIIDNSNNRLRAVYLESAEMV